MGLLERDVELGILATALADAAAGTGSAIAVSGEPGAGKSVLVEAACAAASGLRVVRGGVRPPGHAAAVGAVPRHVARGGGPGRLGPLVEGLRGVVRRPPHRTDRAGRGGPALGRRGLGRGAPVPGPPERGDAVRGAGDLPAGDEIDAQHPARPLLGDFAVLDQPTTLRLAPLSVTARGRAVADTSLDAEKVHAITGGNAFFACEVAKEPDLPLPETVRDAILARTTGIAPEDFEVLQLAAAAPDRVDNRLLPALDVDLPTLRRLHATGLLTRNQHGLLFRHELARLAVESTIPAGGLARLHSRLLDALERMEGRDPAILTHHAVAAADSARVLRYAPLAAQDAARTGSHTEAAAFFQTALQHLDGEPRERATLLMNLAYEQYMSNRLQAAIDSITATFALWERGRRRGRAVLGPRHVRGLRVLQQSPGAGRAARRAGNVARRVAIRRGVRHGPAHPWLPGLPAQRVRHHHGLQRRRRQGRPRTRARRPARPYRRADGRDRPRPGPGRGAGTPPRVHRAGPRAPPRRARVDGLLEPELPRRRTAPTPGGGAGARGVPAVHRRARRPDLQPLADRGPIAAAVPRGALERRARGRRRHPRPLRHAHRHAVAAGGLRPGRPAAYRLGRRSSRAGLGAGGAPGRTAPADPCAVRVRRALVVDRHARPAGGARGDGTPAGR